MSRIYITVAFALSLLAACDLPQNQTEGDPSSPESNSDGEDVIHHWSILRVLDTSGAGVSTMPGVDLDAISVQRDGEFLLAGCDGAYLLETQRELDEENLHGDPEAATLATRDSDTGSGYVSLAGGVLFCPLPLDIQTGDELRLWEVDTDGSEGWTAALAENATSEFMVLEEAFEGSALIVVP